MKLRGFNIEELKFIGFWDQTIFRHNLDGGGVIYKTPAGERLFVRYDEIKKAKREGVPA